VSGFAAVIATNPAAPGQPLLEAAALLSQPPTATWRDDRVSIAVTGELCSLAVEPDLVVAIDGRLDEPASQPGLAAAAFLTAWRHAGRATAGRTIGDFSGLVYERKTGRLHAVRDLTGARPAYISRLAGQGICFSHLRALIAHDGVRLVPNDAWARVYLAGGWPAPRQTQYVGVHTVEPGHVAEWKDLRWVQERVATWDFSGEVPPTAQGRAERFRELFDAATRRRIGAVDGPIAVTTSGGLDSSSVLVAARAVRPGADLVALCLPFTDPLGDERAFQASVAEAAGARLVWVSLDDEGPFGAGWDDVFLRHGGPPLPNWFLHVALERAAVREGVVQVLDGEDGDGVVGGRSEFLADLLVRGRILRLAREAAALRSARDLSWRRLAKLTLRPLLSRRSRLPPGQAWSHAARYLVGGGYLSTIMIDCYEGYTGCPGGLAHPFLDREVVEYAVALPYEERIHHGRTKAVLRNAMGPRLPVDVRTRAGKADLSSAFLGAVTGDQRAMLDEGVAMAAASGAVWWTAELAARVQVPQDREAQIAAFRVAMLAQWTAWVTGRNQRAELSPLVSQ
jgi:asparagine synthetase B (glutamine-hydrolysing)